MNTSVLIDVINQYGYFGIAFLIAIENIFPPIPSEVILAFTGFITLSSKLSIGGSIIAATIGAIIGAAVLYAVGRFLSVERLQKMLAGRLGKILRLKPADIEKAAAFFNRHGSAAVFFGRFVPVVRSLISIPAGMSGYPFGRFVAFSTAGALIWNTVLIFVGRLSGHAWPHIVALIETYGKMALLLLIIVALVCFFIWHKKKKSKN
ncbi:alkaline phosphatase [Liquorilactobacillus sucicola DSM 21376 = JCM 15457]|uniref:Alkaline phosphatase n=1 Tax=Liquorilactobacillus sucicola DSM 21376 = JCM 15457 TaxID=1423806 RepID=A0A023CXZ1_9LACO|nr:DedA family protein [Liquorilactobacillus sucicola]KRN06987.1 alkaline phosphatase [Liquorilactobacillus sucicola DSM 21376 = JCM 15457]GAJ26471.1 alkaline phosphatase [Liquorilactobacillus sucicola DSM 21376 = JCM 15457]